MGATGQLDTPPVLNAFDKASGELVHAVELPARPTGTPMTYMSDGRQFIVMAVSDADGTGLIALALQ